MTRHYTHRIAVAFLIAAFSAPISAQQETVAEVWAKAEQGDAEAQSNLAIRYATGRGVPQDDAEAVRWFRLAADQGDGEAQANLAIMYLDGRGVPQNDVTAYMWFDLAATRSTGEVRDRAVWARATVAEELNASQRAKAKRLAREWDEAHPPVRPVTTVVYTDPRRR